MAWDEALDIREKGGSAESEETREDRRGPTVNRAALQRNHATVSTMAQRSELRRHARTAQWRSMPVEDRTRASIWALDQEIAAAVALRNELVTKIATAQRLRESLR